MQDAALLKSFLTLAVMVAGFAGILLIIKKITKNKKNTNGIIDLKILSKLPVHQKTFLFIIKAGSKTLLIGSNEHSINTLADLTDSNHVPSKIQQLQQKPSNQIPQGNMLQKKYIDNNKDSLTFGNFLKSTFKRQVN